MPAFAAALALTASAGLGCMFSTKPYRGPKSDHFNGEKFTNTHPPEDRPSEAGEARNARDDGFFSILGSLLRWKLFGDAPEPWPGWVDIEPTPPPPERVGVGDLRITFVNHATVLVQMDGINILTDPVWSERVGPVSWAGPARVHAPGIKFEDLPPIDLVLISHNHYDHLDLPTLKRLFQRNAPRIGAGLGTARFLRSQGVPRARDFDWWESRRITKHVRITAVPAQHFSMRGVGDQDTMLWVGFVIEGPAGRVYFAGDTGYGAHFAKIRNRLGPVTVALLPIGAYRPRWFMAPVHIDPFEAVRAHLDLGAEVSLGIHYGTFDQADEGRTEPVTELRAALAGANVFAPRFWVLGPGEGRHVHEAIAEIERMEAARATAAPRTRWPSRAD